MRSPSPPSTLPAGGSPGTDDGAGGGGAVGEGAGEEPPAEQFAEDQGPCGDRDRGRQIAARNRILQGVIEPSHCFLLG